MTANEGNALEQELHEQIVLASCHLLHAVKDVLRPSPICGRRNYQFSLKELQRMFQVYFTVRLHIHPFCTFWMNVTFYFYFGWLFVSLIIIIIVMRIIEIFIQVKTFSMPKALLTICVYTVPDGSEPIWICYPYPNGIAFKSDPVWIRSQKGLV